MQQFIKGKGEKELMNNAGRKSIMGKEENVEKKRSKIFLSPASVNHLDAYKPAWIKWCPYSKFSSPQRDIFISLVGWD